MKRVQTISMEAHNFYNFFPQEWRHKREHSIDNRGTVDEVQVFDNEGSNVLKVFHVQTNCVDITSDVQKVSERHSTAIDHQVFTFRDLAFVVVEHFKSRVENHHHHPDDVNVEKLTRVMVIEPNYRDLVFVIICQSGQWAKLSGIFCKKIKILIFCQLICLTHKVLVALWNSFEKTSRCVNK
jgi:hypothetical protein